MENFGKRLAEYLKMNEISQVEFAKMIDMSKTIVNDYCTGKCLPSLEVFRRMCLALKESADYLLGIEEYK